MDVSMNAKVTCSDGPCGQATRVVIKPADEELTDVVIESLETFTDVEYLVPINHVHQTSTDELQLDCTREELEKMPVFDKVDFYPQEFSGRMGSPYLSVPFYPPEPSRIKLAKDHLPSNELTIQNNTVVEATDGRVGRVVEFLTGPDSECISSLVVRTGPFWHRRDITVAVEQIDRYEENVVHLKLDKQAVEKLPPAPIQRGRTRG